MTTHGTTENRIAGIGWMLATMACFISLDAIMKYALETYPLLQVTWARFFFASVFAAMLCGRQLPQMIKSHSPGLQAARSILLMATTGMFNAGIIKLALPTATTIMFMTPILVTLLSIAVLGERVGIWRWAAIALGFAGAVVVVRPWDSLALSFGSGEVYLLMAALTNACYQIATRRLRFDHPMTSLLFTAVAGAAVTSIFLPYYWLTPDLTGWVLMIASGSAGCAGHLFLIRALSAAPASVVAPYAYSSLVWATMFGFLIWGTWPNSNTLIGAVLIVAAGLLIFLRERKHGTSQPPAVEG